MRVVTFIVAALVLTACNKPKDYVDPNAAAPTTPVTEDNPHDTFKVGGCNIGKLVDGEHIVYVSDCNIAVK